MRAACGDSRQPSLSLIGLGAMGLPMARNLAGARPLSVWNRTERPGREVPGADRPQRLADAAAEVVVTVLPDLEDVRKVLYGEGPEPGLLHGFRERGISEPIVMVCGTVSGVGVRELAHETRAYGMRLVDAPLSGGVLGAEHGELSIMVGAEPELFDTVRSALAPCARSILRMGSIGTGATAKLCNQVVVAQTVTALSEAFALARSAGIEPETLAEALSMGLAGSEVLRQKRDHWIDESFEPGGTISYQVKDLRYATELAQEGGLDLASLRTALQLFERAEAAGDGGLDHTGVYRVINAPADTRDRS